MGPPHPGTDGTVSGGRQGRASVRQSRDGGGEGGAGPRRAEGWGVRHEGGDGVVRRQADLQGHVRRAQGAARVAAGPGLLPVDEAAGNEKNVLHFSNAH